MKFGLFIWIFAFILLAASLQMTLAIEGGSSNSYSTTPTDYLLLHNFNESDKSTSPMNASTGQLCTITAGGPTVASNEMLLNADPEGYSCNLMVDATSPTQSFTCDVYFSISNAALGAMGVSTYSGVTGSGLRASKIIYRDDGVPPDPLVQYYNSVSTAIDLYPDTMLTADTYYVFRAVYDITNHKTNYTSYSLVNNSGTLVYQADGTAPFTTWENSVASIKSIELRLPSVLNNKVDEIACWNWTSPANAYVRPTVSTPDTIPPEIVYFNLTNENGCESWNTNKNTACSTSSVTPTVQFNTNEPAWCAISGSISSAALDKNYTDMGSPRNCTGAMAGEGVTTNHRCTLTPQDELVYDASYLLISCKDASNNQNTTSTSGPLKLSITGLEAAGRTSIGIGIQNALLSGYTNYTDLQIYARSLSNSQVRGTFDRAVKKGSRMWAFNRIGVSDSNANMFNLTPVLYTLELANLTSINITKQVEMLINATK